MITKHILLPTDFSTNARNAIDYAIHIFAKEECTFYIMNALQVSPSGLSSTINKAKDTRLYRAVKEEAERNIKSLLEELKSDNDNPLHKYEGLCISDSLLNAIGKTNIDENISYVFMGTKGSSAVKEVFMGSSTVSLLKNIDFCPLVAVPENYSFDVPDEIAFATNFEHVYSKLELIPLLNLAKLWNSTITVVHVDKGKELTQQQKNSKKFLEEKLHGIPYQFEEVKGTSRISNALAEYAKNNKTIGMVAMINYWHSFFKKLTKEEVVKNVTFHTEVPFLILPLIEE